MRYIHILFVPWVVQLKCLLTYSSSEAGLQRCSYEKVSENKLAEADLHRWSYKKVLWKQAANLQEKTHAEVWFQ